MEFREELAKTVKHVIGKGEGRLFECEMENSQMRCFIEGFKKFKYPAGIFLAFEAVYS